MIDIIKAYNKNKCWDFDGGIHPFEMKSQSNNSPIKNANLADVFYIPVKQHAGNQGYILVKNGDYVLKGQPLTEGDGLRTLPVHAPTSGMVTNIQPYVAAHPSGMSELTIEITPDGEDKWREQFPIIDYQNTDNDILIERIYQAGIAGLGGAVFPTAAKIKSAQDKVKLLIINGAECEPYITCDDRLMRDYAQEVLEGTRILAKILKAEKSVIAIEDNKPEAIKALKNALNGQKDIDIRTIPTKYPSGAAKQLIQVLTGVEVPSGQRSSSIGVLMHNVGTVFAIKRAIINDEPLIERVVTLTGDSIPNKGNFFTRIGTPIIHLLHQSGYISNPDFPVFMGGPLMGFIIPNLNAPITKMSNCLLAPNANEYGEPEPEQSCIRCSACSDACPVNLMPQQLYWFAREEDHEKSEQYNLKDCIECGICAYVCPSHIPLIQYFRQEKSKIWEIKEKARKADEAKARFEARKARLEKAAEARKAKTEKLAQARRAEVEKKQGVDPVQAALARLKAKKAETETPIKTITTADGEVLPDNSEIMAQRKARRLAKQQAQAAQGQNNNSTTTDKKASVAAAIARAKARKQAQQDDKANDLINAENSPADTKKAAVQAAIAHAKARKQVQQDDKANDLISAENNPADAKKAAVQAAIARAKARKQAQQEDKVNDLTSTESSPADAKKAAVQAAIARAKAKKLAQQQMANSTNESPVNTENQELSIASSTTENSPVDAKKAAVQAAIARAKARKQVQQEDKSNDLISAENSPVDAKKVAVQAAIARAKARKQAQQEDKANDLISAENSPADTKKAAVQAAIARAKAKKLAQQQNKQ